MKSSSVEFSWDPKEFKALLDSNERDEAVQISLRYMPDKSARILEVGAGSGRVAKYFSDLGYRHVYGIEINQEAVKHLNKLYPKLKVRQGDLLKMPYPGNYFDVVVSYGVVEHFPVLGVVPPLKVLYRVVKPGGIAVVTIPSLNFLRRLGYFLDLLAEFLNPCRNPYLRSFLRKPLLPARNKKGFFYYVHPQFGDFFEYRPTPHQFVTACREAGFAVLESRPISHLDGMYHLFGPRLVRFENWRFYPNWLGRLLNNLFERIPFFSNHMHLVVLKRGRD